MANAYLNQRVGFGKVMVLGMSFEPNIQTQRQSSISPTSQVPFCNSQATS